MAEVSDRLLVAFLPEITKTWTNHLKQWFASHWASGGKGRPPRGMGSTRGEPCGCLCTWRVFPVVTLGGAPRGSGTDSLSGAVGAGTRGDHGSENSQARIPEDGAAQSHALEIWGADVSPLEFQLRSVCSLL